jgi:hypothetical protein
MRPEYQIAMLWVEGPLSYLEQLCAVSFRDAGHHVKLYTYGKVTHIPDGIEVTDANEVLPQTNFLTHERTGSPALHSDLFRYHLLAGTERTIWADTDAYCARAFETPNGHFYGWESDKHINGGVLGLPQDSDTLGALMDFTSDEFAIPEWYSDEYKRELEDAAAQGHPVHAGEQPWGVWGPHALTHFLHKTGEVKYALPRHALYPFSFKDRRKMLRSDVDEREYLKDDTYSIHFYGRRVRKRLVEREGGVPNPQSLIGRLLRAHDVNPADAPIPQAAHVPPDATPKQPSNPAGAVPTLASKQNKNAQMTQPIDPAARYDRGQLNLTDLADRYGSDKGSTKHRYTELYNMLFQPFRSKNITFLEMGLQIGGPEHGKSENRETTDLPSIRMWLEYFTRAHIIGLDVSDFSWFEHERFSFIRCDMDKRENIANATQGEDDFDIILDDASHASHHQQYAFLELFPKLKSGGLYVIEDLRWQPDAYEIPGITKTADLFQSYLNTGVFAHNDPAIAAGFNDLRLDISGAFVFQTRFRKANRDQVAVIHKR